MVRSEVVGQRSVRDQDGAPDPRMTGLAGAVDRLRQKLDAFPSALCDRAVAEEALGRLALMAASGEAPVDELRAQLLQTVSALNSVRALQGAVTELHAAVELLCGPEQTRPLQ